MTATTVSQATPFSPSAQLALTIGHFSQAADQHPEANRLVVQGDGTHTTIVPRPSSFVGRTIRIVTSRQSSKNREVINAFKMALISAYGKDIGNYVIRTKISATDEDHLLENGLKSHDVRSIIDFSNAEMKAVEVHCQQMAAAARECLAREEANPEHSEDSLAGARNFVEETSNRVVWHHRAALRIEVGKTSRDATITKLVQTGKSEEKATLMVDEAIADEHPPQAIAEFPPIDETHIATESPSGQTPPLSTPISPDLP